MRSRGLWRFWLPPLLYLTIIFALSSLSRIPTPPGVSLDILHYPEYLVLCVLLARAFYASLGFGHPVWAALTAFLAAVAWGVTDEIHQAFVPGRVPDLRDLAHDAAGAAAGAILWTCWALWRGRTRPGEGGG